MEEQCRCKDNGETVVTVHCEPDGQFRSQGVQSACSLDSWLPTAIVSWVTSGLQINDGSGSL